MCSHDTAGPPRQWWPVSCGHCASSRQAACSRLSGRVSTGLHATLCWVPCRIVSSGLLTAWQWCRLDRCIETLQGQCLEWSYYLDPDSSRNMHVAQPPHSSGGAWPSRELLHLAYAFAIARPSQVVSCIFKLVCLIRHAACSRLSDRVSTGMHATFHRGSVDTMWVRMLACSQHRTDSGGWSPFLPLK